jgi:hypothetical protein
VLDTCASGEALVFEIRECGYRVGVFMWIPAVIGGARWQRRRGMALKPLHEIATHERLAEVMPIADLVTAPRKRGAGKGDGKSDGTFPRPAEETGLSAEVRSAAAA